MLSRKFNPSASSARLSQSTSYEIGLPQISSISLTRSGSVVSCNSLILRLSFSPISVSPYRVVTRSSLSGLAYPNFANPGGEVFPLIIGRPVVRPKLHLTSFSQTIVIAVVFTKRQQITRHFHFIPGSFSNVGKTEMSGVGNDHCRFKWSVHDIAGLQKIATIIRRKLYAELILGGIHLGVSRQPQRFRHRLIQLAQFSDDVGKIHCEDLFLRGPLKVLRQSRDERTERG